MSWRVLWLVPLVGVLSACTGIRYVAQAAAGQWDLSSRARPIGEVLQDPKTDARTRELLGEIRFIRGFARAQGLATSGNYQEFVQLDREFVVWFVNASAPLAFEPLTFWFPIVGSFPGLGWFDEGDAQEFAGALREEGWDVNVRGVTAYSTGGWFDDPVFSSMLAPTDHAFGALANVVLHESLHATVLIRDQQYYNESLASYVAGRMTPQYLGWRHGPKSEPLRLYREAEVLYEIVNERLAEVYQELIALYQSARSDAEKLAEKRRIYRALARELEFGFEPNNATLIGFQLYRVGQDEFERLYQRCGHSWPRFLRAARSVTTEDFGIEQRPDFGPVVDELVRRGCPQRTYVPEASLKLRWGKTPPVARRMRRRATSAAH